MPLDDQLVEAYARLGSVWKVAAEFGGLSGQHVHKRLRRLGVVKPIRAFTPDEVERLKQEYTSHADAGTLHVLAASMGRTRSYLCRKARELGLTDASRKRPYVSELVSRNAKQRIALHGHPKGMLGKRHTRETRDKLGEISAARWASMTDEQRREMTWKSRVSRENTNPHSIRENRMSASWRAGWREIGGKRCYFRSAWEANYARYLEWLKCRNQIIDWEHEPKTFWFDKIRRGVCSYKPDFVVLETNGAPPCYHEVKGWMDSRSKTTLARMAKYYPDTRVVLIDSNQYKSIERVMAAIIEGWEVKAASQPAPPPKPKAKRVRRNG